jgi:hypothetical protein
MTPWIQGGPLLEISFIHGESHNDKDILHQILRKILGIRDVELADKNIEEKINAFAEGYFFDEELCIKNHSMKIKLYFNSTVRRKSLLTLDRISSNAIMVTFLFFGDIFDAKEWDQVGIREEDAPIFESLLIELYYLFDFEVGGIAFENDVIGLLNCDVSYPNDFYSLHNLNPHDMLERQAGFVTILWNEKNKILDVLPFPFERIEKNGILIRVSTLI